MSKIDLELCYMTGTEALAAFKEKKLSPVELMKAIIARCEAVNPKVNAITYDFSTAPSSRHAKPSRSTRKNPPARGHSKACPSRSRISTP